MITVNNSAVKPKILFVLLGILIGALFAGWIGYGIGLDHGTKKNISTYEECAAAGYPIQESYPAQCVAPGGKNFTQPVTEQKQPIVVEGNVICLLHRNTDGPQTLECATGLKTTDGKYYSLAFKAPDNTLASAAGSDRIVRITGTLKKEHSKQYQSEGVITVTSFKFI